jgi:hypothetical protein
VLEKTTKRWRQQKLINSVEMVGITCDELIANDANPHAVQRKE